MPSSAAMISPVSRARANVLAITRIGRYFSLILAAASSAWRRPSSVIFASPDVVKRRIALPSLSPCRTIISLPIGSKFSPKISLVRTKRRAASALGLVLVGGGRFRKRAERLQQIDRQRKHRRRVVIGRDLLERLQVSKLKRDWTLAHDLGRVREPLRRLEFTFRRDRLGAPLAFRLSLRRDRALHVLRQIDIFQLDQRHLDAPRLGLRIDNFLDARVELVALAE